ncbi:TolC family protein [Elusimicrobiota bacterium]
MKNSIQHAVVSIQGVIKKILLICLLSAVCCLPSPVWCASPAVKEIDMQEAVRLTYLNNPEILGSLEDFAISEQKLKQARHLYFPQFGFDASATSFKAQRSFVTSEGIGGVLFTPQDDKRLYMGRGFVEYPFYTGGQIKNAIVMAKAAHEKAQSQKSKTDSKALKQVKIKLVEYLFLKEKRQTCETLVKDWSQLKGGSSGPSGRLLANDMLFQLESDLDSIESNELPNTKSEVLNAIGLDLSSEVKLTGTLHDLPVPDKLPELNQALSWAREYRPEYKEEALESEMDATYVAIALAGRHPSISVGGIYEFMGARFPLRKINWAGMLKVHFPLSWDTWATIREQRAKQRKGQMKRLATADKIRLEVEQAYLNLKTDLQKLHKTKKIFEEWKNNIVRVAQGTNDTYKRYLLFNRWRTVSLDYASAYAKAMISRYTLEHAIGKPLE